MAIAHLNGSLNLPSTEVVLRTVTEIAGDTIDKLPDGESGDRMGWIEALVPRLRAVPELEERVRDAGYKTQPIFALRDRADPDAVKFPPLGYAEAARDSYAVFVRLRDEGVIGDGVRFMVALPTVVAGTEPFVVPTDVLALEPAYERRLHAEVEQILETIPAGDLALQWDLAVELGIVEGVFPCPYPDRFNSMVERLASLAGWVPDDVRLGYHLCYGDAQEITGVGEGRHWKQPKDAAKLVAVANAVGDAAPRPVDWWSMPVPIDRDDDAYYAPLADLRLHERGRLYLGLVHHQDGVAGTQRRIDVARQHVDGFGVATECGMGRKPAELVPVLLRIQREVRV